jgi:predicted phage terminase large subunit-like protein
MEMNMKSLTPEEYRAFLRGDFAAFVELCFRYLNPQTEYAHNWHIEVMAAKLDACRRGQIRRLIVNVPPRHLKSLCASVALPAWNLGHDPSSQNLCVSYAQDLADKLSRDCMLVMMSPWYRELFPNTRLSKVRQAVSEFTTTAHGFRKATSVDGVLTGRGADFIIIDDPLKPEEALSETQRKKVNAWYGNTLFSRQNNKGTGRIVIIMQRLHEDDLVGHVLGQGQWDLVRFPAIAEADEEHIVQTLYGRQRFGRRAGEALHPERESLEVLDVIKRTLGTYDFAGQYQQAPAPLEGGMVKREWFRTYAPGDLPDKFDQVIQSWDTANKANELANYSVCTTWGLKGKQIYLLNVFRKQLDFPNLLRAVLDQWQEFSATVILVEDAASGVQLAQQLKDKGIYSVKAIKPEGDKAIRLHAQSTTIENGFVCVPREAHWLDKYLHEMTTFPKSKHSDQVDSTSQALAWIREGGREPAMLQFVREECERIYGKEYVERMRKSL